jgi:3-deoxy-manno-octulosonate cytidylyltransferase (CMP-KDO synthetase)
VSLPFRVVIPARFASRRLPAKALAEIDGVPLVVRVLRQALRSSASEVIVATDHREIEAVVTSAGGVAVMTSPAHPSGTDRIAELASSLGWAAGDIVVNVQGDEPMMPPALIDECAALLGDGQADIATLCHPVRSEDEMHRPDVVKVVRDRAGYALYFSRAPIPFRRDQEALTGSDTGPGAGGTCPGLRHVGIYAYRVHSLLAIAASAPSPLESAEKLEQLRALWLGLRIRVGVASELPGPGVDTAEDLARVSAMIAAGADR